MDTHALFSGKSGRFIEMVKCWVYGFIQIIIRAIEDAFYELLFPLKAVTMSLNGKKLFYIDKELDRLDKASSVIQKTICYNQGAYIQHSFMGAEKHKEMKRVFYEMFKDKNVEKNIERLRSDSDLAVKTKSFIDFMNYGLYENVVKNFEFIQAYFMERDDVMPRICIKGRFKTLYGEEENILTIFRDRAVDYISDYDSFRNSALRYTLEEGSYYLQNNIPKAILNDSYYNSRIDYAKIENLVRLSKSKYMAEQKLNKEWSGYWKDYSVDKDKSAFYKSTLVIPMTLWNNESITRNFVKKVAEKDRKANIKSVDRYIFGMLCIDHVKKDYFVEEYDMRWGYMFADILSLYLFNRMVYTEISETFYDIEKYLKSKNMIIDIDKIDIPYDELYKDLAERDYFSFKPRSSKRNHLFSLDEDLMNFVSTKKDLS